MGDVDGVLTQPAGDLRLALQRSEAQLRLMRRVAGLAMWEWDIASDVMLWSDDMEEILGFSPVHLRSRADVAEYVHPDDRSRWEEAVRASFEDTCEHRVEVRFRRPDGQQRWLAVLWTTELDAGAPARMVGVVMDITERKERELALAEAQRELATLMANLPGMAYRCLNDEQWTMLFISEGCRELTGYAPAALVGNSEVAYADLIRGDQRKAVEEHVAAALEEQGFFELRYPIVTATGEERWVWERGRGVFDDEGELRRLEGFIFDITDEHRLEDQRDRLELQLRHSQKMEAVGQLAGGVAHDFNNILTAILGTVELVTDDLEEEFPDGKFAEDMRQIEQSALRAASLTRQLLAFSRRQVMRPRRLDLNETLRGLETMLRRLISEDIALELLTTAGLSAVEADPGQLEQVVVNLVVNARDAMPDGGQLTLETQEVILDASSLASHQEARPGAYVQLTVSDSGCGMEPSTLGRVFEPFFTTKSPGSGTGLGLSTVYGIVHQAGGFVTAYSEPGQGTTFRVYLPAADGVVEGEQKEPDVPQVAGGDETVIVCEDDTAVRDLTSQLLREAGYEVLVASTPGEALAAAEEHGGEISLLVTDVIMPQMNGRQLAEELQRRRPALRALFVSGYTANVIAHHGVLDEGVAFLEKPFSRRQLLKEVRELLDGRGSRAQEAP